MIKRCIVSREISFRCSVARTSCAGGRRKQFCRNLSFLNSYVHSAELHNKQEFLRHQPCRFFAQNGCYIFSKSCILRSLRQKILRSCFFREELDCTTPDLQAFFCGLLPGRKAPRIFSFLQEDGWRTLDTNELALNTSLERCKCTRLVHSAIFFTDGHE